MVHNGTKFTSGGGIKIPTEIIIWYFQMYEKYETRYKQS